MNERIRDLALECIVENIASPVWVFTDAELDQFADLIVRECGVALRPMLRDMISRGQAWDLIRQHFGVEESGIDQQLRNRSTYFGNNP